jgi:hypothetical protein
LKSDKDFVTLQIVCERLKNDNKELREQIQEKENQWKIIESKNNVDIKHFRELCEKILAKDKREMVLGKEYSWSNLSNGEICEKANKSYDDYNEKKTLNIKLLLSKYQERGEELDGLKASLTRIMNGEKISKDVLDEIIADPTKTQREEKVKSNADNVYKKAEAEGKIKTIVEEDADIQERKKELEKNNPLMKQNVGYSLSPKTPEIIQSPKKVKYKNDKKQEMVDAEIYKWYVLEIIGKFGCVLKSEIVDKISSLYDDISKYKVENALKMLSAGQDLLKVTKLAIPSGQFDLFELGRVGTTIFEHKFRQAPVESYAQTVIKEHDNLEHGYGILLVASSLSKTNRYKKVDCFNRKHPIKVTINKTQRTYIPDIFCVDNNGEVEYYEYELNNHTKKDFREKCDKMCQVMSILRFVGSNRNVCLGLKDKVDDWIKKTGLTRLKNIKVEIHSYSSISNDEEAPICYDLGQSEEAIRNIWEKK